MKILLITLVALSSLSVYAKADCSIYSSGPVTKKLEKVLKKKGYNLTKNKAAPFQLKYDQSDVEDTYLEITPPNRIKIVTRKIGTYTAFNIWDGEEQVAYAYGEASSLLFRSDYYIPTQGNKDRSYRRAVRDLKRSLEDCIY